MLKHLDNLIRYPPVLHKVFPESPELVVVG
jgi:hypothetical protein